MTKQLHFCIHGAGGLGSVVGGFLARGGHKVTLIARKPHVEAIRQGGLQIEGVRAQFVQRDNLFAVETPAEVEDAIDYYILLTKAKGTDQALADATVLVDRTACALTLQNGVGKEGRLQAAFGKDKVIGGSIMDGATLLEPGRALNHMAVPVTAYFGELGGGESDRTRTMAEALDSAGMGSRSTADITHVHWEKLVQVGSASSWSASTLGGIKELDFIDGVAVREGAAQYVLIVKDLLAIYNALGYEPQNFFAPVSRLVEINGESFDEALAGVMAMVGRFKPENRPVRTSMHDDLVAGRRMEVDEILGPLAEAAERLGVDAPTFLGAYRVLKTLNTYL
ncbi:MULTISPECIES: ketopantoate reductase family protein [Sphingomonadales]|jgi:2-dehydropantoate 2-reductase|uniref:2-dehydropantoate 2-reductase n=1 Tax=Sphingobium fuliginis (strain ATCC 27551) TaxID=336203 RepID=A0ABQ1FEZ0_SPHSA|nr:MULTISPECIES: 2-dehydropantoate 2-reductase N-terminal domain-containing protein [Sphingomonadaceae]RYL95236.1 ketopantoate reductase family protein [Sphingobium fuliginis]GGA07601.1 2-dehydropantoate 2-reductase [Sphingobium fuliginis]CCA93864.1 ketopantoate reductase ApbA/PanE [Novosphingobium sp. PP1Y]